MIGLLLAASAAALPAPHAAAPVVVPAAAAPLRRELWTVDQIAFPNRHGAVFQRQLAALAPDHSMKAVAARLAGFGIVFQRRRATIDTAALDPDMVDQIRRLPSREPFVVPDDVLVTVNVVVSRRRLSPNAPLPPHIGQPAEDPHDVVLRTVPAAVRTA